jgi:hypothetical protein
VFVSTDHTSPERNWTMSPTSRPVSVIVALVLRQVEPLDQDCDDGELIATSKS